MSCPFETLENPLTSGYRELKDFILSEQFPWFYNNQATPYAKALGFEQEHKDLSFYSHAVLHGPAHPATMNSEHRRYPKSNSQYLDAFDDVINDIMLSNNMNVHCIYRINANAVHPVEGNVLTVPHTDHEFPHKNLLIYLTDAGGRTYCDKDGKDHYFDPCEDDIVTFEGLHYMQPPKFKRRVVIVVTYL